MSSIRYIIFIYGGCVHSRQLTEWLLPYFGGRLPSELMISDIVSTDNPAQLITQVQRTPSLLDVSTKQVIAVGKTDISGFISNIYPRTAPPPQIAPQAMPQMQAPQQQAANPQAFNPGTKVERGSKAKDLEQNVEQFMKMSKFETPEGVAASTAAGMEPRIQVQSQGNGFAPPPQDFVQGGPINFGNIASHAINTNKK